MTKIKNFLKNRNKISFTIFIVVWILSFVAFINSLILWDWFKITMSFSALVLYLAPFIITRFSNIKLPTALESTYYLFIFAGLILGETFAFYGPFLWWDVVLHFLSGFLLAAVGFSLVAILNHNKTSKLFAILFAFCFSMTLGAIWECLEFSFDSIVRTDAQKDAHLNNISTITLQRDGGNQPVRINNIVSTNINLENGEVITIDEGFLDIGLMDTMKDLFVNTGGALLFCLFCFLSYKQQLSAKFTANFIPTKKSTKLVK